MSLLFRCFADHCVLDPLAISIRGLGLSVEIDIAPIPDFSIVICVRENLDGVPNTRS